MVSQFRCLILVSYSSPICHLCGSSMSYFLCLTHGIPYGYHMCVSFGCLNLCHVLASLFWCLISYSLSASLGSLSLYLIVFWLLSIFGCQLFHSGFHLVMKFLCLISIIFDILNSNLSWLSHFCVSFWNHTNFSFSHTAIGSAILVSNSGARSVSWEFYQWVLIRSQIRHLI